MSNMYLDFLRERPELSIKTEEIVALNEITNGKLLVPFTLNFPFFGSDGQSASKEAEILFFKATLRTRTSHIFCSQTLLMEKFSIQPQHRTIRTQFEFFLTPEAIFAIEKKREKNMEFTMAIATEAAIIEKLLVGNQANKTFVSGFEKGYGHIDFTIPQSDWVDRILPGLGHQSFALYELPTAHPVIPVEYSLSIHELEEAKKYFANGDYHKAVGHCRSAIEPIKKSRAILSSLNQSESDGKRMNSFIAKTEEWLDDAFPLVSGMTSKAHHPQEGLSFTRKQAEIIMMITLSIIGYAGSLDHKLN